VLWKTKGHKPQAGWGAKPLKQFIAAKRGPSTGNVECGATTPDYPARATFPRLPHPIESLDIQNGVIDMAKATFAAGCFWGVEATFRQLPGVISTRVGYIGGHSPNPTYKQVCTDTTGHAEAVEVDYDPAKLSYDKLLDVFWENHDPTQLNRQGPDWGKQYRSAIFFHTPEQEAAAKASKERLEKSRRFSKPIVTQIVPAETFFEAEDYHQQYLEKKGLASCHIKA
jgi:peptide-methionine (S)-S-oxide reductase